MARIVSEVVGIKFSTIAKDGGDDPIILSEEDLEVINDLISTLDEMGTGRVVELDLGED